MSEPVVSRRTAARHGRLRPQSGLRFAGRILAACVGVGVLSAVSIVVIALSMIAGSARPSVDLGIGSTDAGSAIPEIGAIEGGVNILLAGSDSAEGSAAGAYGDRSENLNDVTMLMHISEDHSTVEVISFPRDMYVPIPSCTDPVTGAVSDPLRSAKINTSLGYGGLACTVQTVEQLTGLDIPYAALIQFDGVIEMSNAVGGVDVCVATPIEDEYTGLNLSAGTHTLVGAEALAFLRTRHGVGDGSDLTRISSQQVYLSSLVRKVKDASTLSNPVALYGLGKAAVSNMQLSTSLENVNTLVSIGLAVKDVDLASVVFVQYPTFIDGDGVYPSEEAAATLNAALLADQPIALTGTTGGGSESTDGSTPAATDPAATADPAATGDAAATTDPGTPAPGETAVALPSDVSGQTADQQTCTVGRTLDEQ
ncbi:LytR family transcriptional regulator [Rathayibacter sp. VKM Ac-2804]|jgi:LCP family protein required for cell wall assembly|uniref:LCP family protein n=1 Tax=Rathayibacter sp. VKM Ac-2804 TaxID=2609257 RepID=UPI00132EC6A3|nr:LCP family protein [Rathayibacter sp. VKM Ac-2804]QHF23455.1 LytR family transcriptional regulator [Rathayibacter sp. VKM Ac-2804]